MMIQAVLGNPHHPEYGVATIPFPIPHDQYTHCIPKGNFIVQKTGQHPMRTRLRLFLEWGITFEEPYIIPERADRAVAYANREDLERNLPQSNKAEDVDVSGAYAVSRRGGMAHEPAAEKPRRRGGKQMKTYGEEDL